MTTLETLIQYLKEETTITHVYNGGGDEDSYISFESSNGVTANDKDDVIKELAENILNKIEQYY